MRINILLGTRLFHINSNRSNSNIFAGMKATQQRNIVLQLAGFTMIAMPAIASVVDFFADSFELSYRLRYGSAAFIQIFLGILIGLAIGFIAQWLIDKPFLQEVNIKYSGMISELDLGKSEIIFISICAGVGEEILFRGALQPILMGWLGEHAGIWATALGFVAMHGYLNLKEWRISIYGIYMTIAIAGLGYATEIWGIWTAIVAHTVVDIYLLHKMHAEQSEGETTD